jgi:hypothetical protein
VESAQDLRDQPVSEVLCFGTAAPSSALLTKAALGAIMLSTRKLLGSPS